MIKAFRLGWKGAGRYPVLVGIWFTTNILFAWIATAPFRRVFASHAGHSLIGDQPLGLMSFNYVSDLMVTEKVAWTSAQAGFSMVVLLWILLSVFMAAATLGTLESGRPFSWVRFAGNGGRYFFSFLGLFLVMAVVLVLMLLVVPLFAWLQTLILGEDPYQNIVVWMNVFKWTLAFLLTWYWKRIFDYARIDLVLTKKSSFRISLKRALVFSVRNFRSAFGLGLCFLGVSLVVFTIYTWIKIGANVSSTMLAVVVILVGILYTAIRNWIRVAQWSGELALYYGLQPNIREEAFVESEIETNVDEIFESTLPGIDQFQVVAAEAVPAVAVPADDDEVDPETNIPLQSNSGVDQVASDDDDLGTNKPEV